MSTELETADYKRSDFSTRRVADFTQKCDNYFMRILPFLALGLLPVAALAQPAQMPTTIANPPVRLAPAPRPGEPKAQLEFDLRALLKTLNSFLPAPENVGYEYEVPAAISGGRIGYFGLSEWRRYFVEERGKIQYRFDKIEVETLEKESARVKISYALLAPNFIAPLEGGAPKTEIRVLDQSETLDLKLEDSPIGTGKRWRIVAPSAEKLPLYQPLSLQTIAYYGANRAAVLPQLRAQISMSHLKHLALGVLQFVQDYDERFVFQNDFLQEAISPYVQAKTVFLIPGTQTLYTFNDNLSDKSLATINEPSQTVLFYEGENETPIFRYKGKAAICFADGHVKLVSPEEAKSLIWKL